MRYSILLIVLKPQLKYRNFSGQIEWQTCQYSSNKPVIFIICILLYHQVDTFYLSPYMICSATVAALPYYHWVYILNGIILIPNVLNFSCVRGQRNRIFYRPLFGSAWTWSYHPIALCLNKALSLGPVHVYTAPCLWKITSHVCIILDAYCLRRKCWKGLSAGGTSFVFLDVVHSFCERFLFSDGMGLVFSLAFLVFLVE